MAQTSTTTSSTARRLSIDAANLDVPVSVGGPDVILDLVVSEAARLAIELKNEGAQPLDAFQVLGKVHKDGNFVLLFSAAADFTSPAGLVVDASGDLTVLAAGASGWLVLDVLAFYQIQLKASSNAAGVTQVDVFARGV